MAEPAIHFSIALAAFSHMGFDLLTSTMLAAVAVLPDLDVLVRMHRSVTHSFVVCLPLALLAMPFYWIDPRISIVLLGVWLSLSSHIFLDLIGGYCPALWPILKEDLKVSAGLQVKFGRSFLLEPLAKISRRPLDMSQFEHLDASLVTGEGLLISAVLVLLSLPRLSPLW